MCFQESSRSSGKGSGSGTLRASGRERGSLIEMTSVKT